MRKEKRLRCIWRNMVQRCRNPNAPNSTYYGGRGIKVCPSWERDYKRFERWALRNGYKDGLSLDRKDVDGNYSPQNCRWVPQATQVYNRRNTRWVEGMPLKHYCEKEGLCYSTMLRRARRCENL